MVHLSPYIFFDGNCRAALTFYQGCLGGELSLLRFGDSPVAAHMPAAAQDAIMHGTLTTQDFILMAADAGRAGESLSVGNSLRLSLHFDDTAEIAAIFARLSDGGHVIDPLADTPWGSIFGTLTDRFGITWLLHLQRPAVE